MRSSRGFTLIELMVSLALAGLIVAGAMQMHVSFNRQSQRQNQIAEMQQTLRVSMLMLERAIRQAGRGIPGGVIAETKTVAPGCAGPPFSTYAFQWYDKGGFPGVPTTVATTADGDPDWFQVLYTDDTTPVYAYDGTVPPTLNIFPGTGVPPDLSTFNDGDLFRIVFPNGDSSCLNTATGKSDAPCGPLSCLFEISVGTNHGGTGTPKKILHDQTKSTRCFNAAPTADTCAKSVTNAHRGLLKRLSGQATQYRVMAWNEPGNPTATPKLTMRVAPIGSTDVTTVATRWQIIAENIEDMQLALVMQDGRVCYQTDDALTPAPGCNPTQAVAVRVTLVARSEAEIAGYREGLPIRSENQPATTGATPKDGYLRRAVTSQIELRNLGSATP